jgi:hypothetical protein
MKKITKLVTAVLLTCTFSLSTALAQAPEKMSYQAVIRDAGNALVQTQGVGIQITILKGGATGTPVFVETHNVTTNTNGLVSLEIGTGTLVSGNFSTIDWGADTYFIQTETDPTTAGGTNYTITGTTQLMSVPYALHAKTADNFTGTITETDPVFGASVASGITAADTANWNNNVDTQIDSTGIAAFGYVAGPHTIDTDTHIDSVGIASLGFVAGGIITELDGDPTNEIQVLSKTGSMVSLSNGGGNFIDDVNDADADPLNELQTVSKTLDIVTLSNTGGSFSVNDADADPLNELQDISLSGNNLSITNGSTVDLSNVGFDGDFNNLTNVPVNLDTDYTDDFDGQYSSLSGAPTNVSAFTNDAGYLTSFTETDPIFTAAPAFGITNTLMTNWNTAYGWGDHSTQGYLTSFTEVDGSVTNEIQTLSVSGNNLTISGAGGNTVTLPTSSTPWTISGSDIYRAGIGKVGINTTTPLATLDVDGDIRGTSFKLLNVGNVGNRFKIGTNANGTDTDIEYATGWLTFMPSPSNVAFALDNNGNAIMGLGTNKVGIGTATPTEKLEVNGSVKIVDGTEGAGKVLTSDANGKASWERPVDNVISTGVITRGALPVGASCPVGGSYTAPSSVLEPGVYMYTLYSCAGQIGQSVSGFNVDIVFISGTGDASYTWHNFNENSCGDFYTGVVRVTSTSSVAVRYSSSSGSSFTVPGANAEQVRYWRIN